MRNSNLRSKLQSAYWFCKLPPFPQLLLLLLISIIMFGPETVWDFLLNTLSTIWDYPSEEWKPWILVGFIVYIIIMTILFIAFQLMVPEFRCEACEARLLVRGLSFIERDDCDDKKSADDYMFLEWILFLLLIGIFIMGIKSDMEPPATCPRCGENKWYQSTVSGD